MRKTVAVILLIATHAMMAAQVYSEDAGFFKGHWTENDFKFLMIEIITITVAMLMMYVDKGAENPRFPEIALTFILSGFFVFMAYEWAIMQQTAIFWAMVTAFVAGSMSLKLTLHIYRVAGPMLESWIRKKLG